MEQIYELPMSKKAKRGIIPLPFVHVSQLLLTICSIHLGQPIASTSYASQPRLGMQTAGGSGEQMATILNQEPFDLASWIPDKIGLNTAREYHKQRLEKSIDAFDKAGYRRETVNLIDDEVLKDIDMELQKEKN
jgi:hypothetical protein